ncbi:MAG: methyltransferase domain-containing protein, partial [Sediminibacterium sp.]|nr:methyltransferase domain-containing protein [Sediminibacterium sp.]
MEKTQFNDNQFENLYGDYSQYLYWNVYRNRFIYKIIHKLKVNKILDVGSGRGIVTDFLFKKNIQIQGVELGDSKPILNATVSIQYNMDVFNLDKNLPIKTISLFDVIEHLEHPIEFIKKLKLHFNHLENILITVPARNEIWSSFDEFYGHYKRYTLEDFKILEQELNGKILYKQYFFQILYYLICLNKTLNKNKRKTNLAIV